MWKWIGAVALKEKVVDSIGDESIGVREYDFKKYGTEELIASSVGLGWSGLSAALCAHRRGVTEYQGAESGAEICVAICPSNSLVTRLIDGVVDRTYARAAAAKTIND
jgi:hypothetical protein